MTGSDTISFLRKYFADIMQNDYSFCQEEIFLMQKAMTHMAHESLELWKLLKSKSPKQVKKITEIAKIVLD